MKVTVNNFQSIGHAELTCAGLTVVVGPSDRGKSALLRAIEAALFNRPGEQFVRYGEKQATVTVQLPEEEITWEKGSGVNRFILTNRDPDGDDTVFSRVGTKAPAPLQALGFKDVVIGARLKDDGKFEGGETIRPQVARQFDRIFLLDESGAFLNEVLVGLSRLGVLQRAGRLCSLDLRQERALLKTRETDLAGAEKERATLLPVVELSARVARLTAWQEQTAQTQARADRLSGLVVGRGLWLTKAAVTLPPAGPRRMPDASLVRQLRPLLIERQRWQRLQQGAVPSKRVIPPTLLTQLGRYPKLKALMIEQRQQRNWFQQYTAEAARWTEVQQEQGAALAALKRELKVCPVCTKPW